MAVKIKAAGILLLCSLLWLQINGRQRAAAHVLGPPTVSRSAPIVITPDGEYLVTVNPDSNSISVVSASLRRLVLEIPVGRNPQTVAADWQRGLACVANQDDDSVSIVDLGAGPAVTRLTVGSEPFGVAMGPDGRIYVSNSGSATVQVIDLSTLETVATIPTETAPRGLALSSDAARLYVSHFFSGKLSVISTQTLNVDSVISTGADSNISQSVILGREGTLAYLPQTRSNVTNRALLFDSTVFPIVSLVDLRTGENLLRRRIALDIADRPVNLPLDAALTSSGKLYVVNAGSDNVSVINLATQFAVARAAVGNNPRGIVLAPDERFAYVNNTLSGTVSVLDTQADKVVAEIPVTQIPLAPDVLNGKILFNNSSRPQLSRDRWISCATCHFDGGMDGRTWFFRDGPRNTPSLQGLGDTLPMHWSGDLDELQDVESTVRNIQAGSGLADGPDNCQPACDQAPPNARRSKDLDDLAAYMQTVTFRSNPNLNPDGALTEAAERGRAIFFSSETGCASCHLPPLYTDRARHDVGTGRSPLETKGTAFDTPSLRGIHQTAPYLHDGSAATLLDVLTTTNQTDVHGKTSHLGNQELEDMVQFLRSLPFGR